MIICPPYSNLNSWVCVYYILRIMSCFWLNLCFAAVLVLFCCRLKSLSFSFLPQMNPSTLRLDPNPITFTGSTHYKLFKPSPSLCRPSLYTGTLRKTRKATVAAVAVADSTRNSLARINELSQVSGVLGCQWGDEGKGKLVDILAQHFDVVARCQVYSLFSHYYYALLCSSYMYVTCHTINLLIVWPFESLIMLHHQLSLSIASSFIIFYHCLQIGFSFWPKLLLF